MEPLGREIATKVKNNTTIDWDIKERVRERLMFVVRRTLRKYGLSTR